MADRSNSASTGTVADGFERVRDLFDSYLLTDSNYSAQVAMYWRGQLIVDLVGGPGLDADSVSCVFSSSKGVAALVIGRLIDAGKLDPSAPVVEYWPEFGAKGKEKVLVSQLLSHQAGLIGLDGGMTVDDVVDSTAAAERIAQMRPMWRPGAAFGYHGITIGIFLEELVRRVTGTTLQEVYEKEIRAPRNIDFWLGLPESEDHRYRPVEPPVLSTAQLLDTEEHEFPSDSLSVFGSNNPAFPKESGLALSPNDRRVRAAGFPAAFGVGSARGLAQVYSSVFDWDGDPVVSKDTLEIMAQEQTWGPDRVFGNVRSFGIVFMRPTLGLQFGSVKAFGHDGAAGRLAFADPLHDLAFGYIPWPMQYTGYGVGADPKSLELSRLVRETIRQHA
jgi:CubicO group peptidase (beta-lactamase class C family)